MWRSPNGTIRNILGGVIFREPIICRNVPRLVPGWTQPIVIGRHAFGDQYAAPPTSGCPARARLTIKFEGDDGNGHRKGSATNIRAPASPWRCTISTIRSAISPGHRLNYGLNAKYPVFLSTKNTILKAYDGRFKDIFQEVFETEFKPRNSPPPGSSTSIA